MARRTFVPFVPSPAHSLFTALSWWRGKAGRINKHEQWEVSREFPGFLGSNKGAPSPFLTPRYSQVKDAAWSKHVDVTNSLWKLKMHHEVTMSKWAHLVQGKPTAKTWTLFQMEKAWGLRSDRKGAKVSGSKAPVSKQLRRCMGKWHHWHLTIFQPWQPASLSEKPSLLWVWGCQTWSSKLEVCSAKGCSSLVWDACWIRYFLVTGQLLKHDSNFQHCLAFQRQGM